MYKNNSIKNLFLDISIVITYYRSTIIKIVKLLES